MASTITRSQFKQSISVPALRSYLAEFISTFFFVFAVVGSVMSGKKIAPVAASDPSSYSSSSALVVEAMAHSFALSTAVYLSSCVSTGYVNPAVTLGLAVGGHISIPTAMFYWATQLVASTMACLFLRLLTAGNAIPTSGIAIEMTGFGGSALEGLITFALVYTVYAVGDQRRGGSGGVMGSIAIGLMAGANVLAAGPFTGGSMNPARSFGSAMISGDFKNQGVYWVGPLIGGALAGLLYQNVVFPSSSSPASASDSSRAMMGEGLVI